MTAKNCDKELRYFGRLGEITEDNINEMIAYLLNDEGVIIGSVSASKQEECAEIFVSEEDARRLYTIRPNSLEIMTRHYDKLLNGFDDKKRFPRKDDWVKQPETRETHKGSYFSQLRTIEEALTSTRENPNKVNLYLPELP